ncbi:hypothetical protein CSB20_04515, partial [bacterium DOLZORAL124_64_63]
DCGCTVPTLDRNTLLPGESTVININFNSKKFVGNVFKKVTILSNDPDNPEIIFPISANVQAALLVDPPSRRLGFQRAPMGTSYSRTAIFTATEAPQLEIQAKKSRRGLFQVEVENNYEGDPRKAALHVTVPKTMKAGRQRDNVRVRTNLPEEEFVDIDLSAWPLQALMVSQDKINFRFKKDLTTSIHVTPAEQGTKFNITEVTCDLPEIDIQVEVAAPNKKTVIHLSGTAIDKDSPRARKHQGRIKGNLHIRTDLPHLPEMVVPISYMVRM